MSIIIIREDDLKAKTPAWIEEIKENLSLSIRNNYSTTRTWFLLWLPTS